MSSLLNFTSEQWTVLIMIAHLIIGVVLISIGNVLHGIKFEGALGLIHDSLSIRGYDVSLVPRFDSHTEEQLGCTMYKLCKGYTTFCTVVVLLGISEVSDSIQDMITMFPNLSPNIKESILSFTASISLFVCAVMIFLLVFKLFKPVKRVRD